MIGWFKNLFRKSYTNQIKVRFELDNGKYYEELVDAEKFRERVTELQKELNPIKPLDQIPFIWCLVGSIVDQHYFGEDKQIKIGTKQFSPGTKVYCFPPQWGDGYEKIKVIGRPRKTTRFITVVTESKYITNWRLQAVYSPHIIKTMIENCGWTDKEADKDKISEMLKWLPKKTDDTK
jgi:hypothetical protein